MPQDALALFARGPRRSLSLKGSRPTRYHEPADMLVLAADSSTSFSSVALCLGEHVLAEVSVDAGRKHSETLLATVEWLLAQAGKTLQEIELLAIAAGPGSFTGLRVGLATWKGLALGLGLPLAGVSTLDAMARAGALHEGTLCPLIDAKMGEVFGARYVFESGARRKMGEERAAPVESFVEECDGTETFAGDGASRYRRRIADLMPGARFLAPCQSLPRAGAVAAEALDAVRNGLSTDAGAVSPVYLRVPQAEAQRSAARIEGANV